MSDPLVSIVVPCYNYARYLPECLGSIFSQQGGYDIEVIAVDDACVDNSSEILRNWGDARLRIITHEKNQGHAAAVTHGIEAARGKYVARIDPDDRYRPHYLATLVPILEAHPEVGLAYGDAAMINQDGLQTADRSDRAHNGQDYYGNELVALLQENFICAPTALGRREAWLGALPIPPKLAFNDVWFNLMMARKWDFCYRNVVVADYRVHSENWHARIITDRTDEPSLLWLLDTVYSTHEKDASLEAAKRAARDRVYGAQLLTLARKYFRAGMAADARRCYLRALRYQPKLAFHADLLRQLFGSLIGIKSYEAIKSAIKRG